MCTSSTESFFLIGNARFLSQLLYFKYIFLILQYYYINFIVTLETTYGLSTKYGC